MFLSELIRIRTILRGALSTPAVNQPGRATDPGRRLRTVTPHLLFLSVSPSSEALT